MISVLCFIIAVLFSYVASDQTVAVRGTLMCGEQYLDGAEIKLFSNHRMIPPDSLLATEFSDTKGFFEITGTVDSDDMEPEVQIHHRCNNQGFFGYSNLCEREVVYRVPSSYIAEGPRSRKWFELGTRNLEKKQRTEKMHCFY